MFEAPHQLKGPKKSEKELISIGIVYPWCLKIPGPPMQFWGVGLLALLTKMNQAIMEIILHLSGHHPRTSIFFSQTQQVSTNILEAGISIFFINPSVPEARPCNLLGPFSAEKVDGDRHSQVRWRFVSGYDKPRLMGVAIAIYFPGGSMTLSLKQAHSHIEPTIKKNNTVPHHPPVIFFGAILVSAYVVYVVPQRPQTPPINQASYRPKQKRFPPSVLPWQSWLPWLNSSRSSVTPAKFNSLPPENLPAAKTKGSSSNHHFCSCELLNFGGAGVSSWLFLNDSLKNGWGITGS